jgi:hypothetical protein
LTAFGHEGNLIDIIMYDNKATPEREEVLLVQNKKHTNPVIYPPMWCKGMQKYYG